MSSWNKNSNDSIPRTLGSSPRPSPESAPVDQRLPLRSTEALIEHGGAFLFAYSPTAKALTSWTDNALDVLGVREVAITRDGNVFLRHVHPDDRFLIFNDLERAIAGASDYRVTYRWIRPDTDAVRWLHCRAGLVHRDGQPSFEGFIIDLSSEFAGTTGLSTGPDALPTVLAALPATVITLDRDARIVRVNRPSESDFPIDFGDPNFRFEQLAVGRSFLDGFVDDERRRTFIETLETIFAESAPRHLTRVSRAGGVFTLEIRPLAEQGAVVGALIVITDASALAALEQRVGELQLAEGLRTLATGVVHNFNNALQRIIGQAVLLSDHATDPVMVEQVSDAIIELAGRTGDLTRQLFAFEEDRRPEPVPIDLNVVTMAAVNRIKDLFSTGLKVSIAFGAGSTVLGHHEPLVSAIERAIRAMRDRTPRDCSLSIKTFDGAGTLASTGAPEIVRIEMSEVSSGGSSFGPPIDAGTLDDIRTDFARYNGAVSLSTDEFGRQRLAVELPLGNRAQEAVSLRRRSLSVAPSEPGILIVDDDTMVLETIQAVLADLGFHTLTAADSGAALDIVRRHGASLRLVLLDALMPGMDGATLLRRITRRAPHIKVLGFSGAPQHITDTLLEAGALSIIRKPVDPLTLKAAVRGVLSGREAA